MSVKKKLGLVAIFAAVVSVILVIGIGAMGGVSTASTPPDPVSCYCTMPALSLSQVGVYWESMAAYTDGILSVDFEVHNNSSNIANAHDMHVVGTDNTNGVMTSDHGRNINVVTAGECELLTMKYSIPGGVSHFRTSVHAETHDQCGNSYTYGGAMP